jgi:hypothetical protein
MQSRNSACARGRRSRPRHKSSGALTISTAVGHASLESISLRGGGALSLERRGTRRRCELTHGHSTRREQCVEHDFTSFSYNPVVVQVSAKLGPMKDGRSFGGLLQCAQECAQTIALIRCPRIAEVVVDLRLKAKATVFQKRASEIRLRARKIREICKCFRGVYLQTHGEVAERLKAAVC